MLVFHPVVSAYLLRVISSESSSAIFEAGPGAGNSIYCVECACIFRFCCCDRGVMGCRHSGRVAVCDQPRTMGHLGLWFKVNAKSTGGGRPGVTSRSAVADASKAPCKDSSHGKGSKSQSESESHAGATLVVQPQAGIVLGGMSPDHSPCSAQNFPHNHPVWWRWSRWT
jgi:hypothetical protein